MGLNTIDLTAFLEGKISPAEEQELARSFVDLSSRWGFFYVRGYESVVPKDLVDKVFQYNASFFDLPQATKDRLAFVSSKANRGYLAQGREQPSLSKDEDQIALERAESGDQKETFEIGNDSDPVCPEHWPEEDELPGFKETMNTFHRLCDKLHLRILSLLAISLGLAPDFFVAANNGRAHNLRLLHYPPAKRSGSSNRLGAHTDFGTVTLLWQDGTGGLQVTGPDGDWVNVTPKEDTFVINIGDILQRWSNDKLKSTVHRAILPSLQPGEDPEELTKTRRSVAYFCNPNSEAIIECIPGLGEPKYEPITAGEYYAAALEAEIGV
ncbi:oxidoreductase [Leucosporidium creatinivorum]|uniref:Oxidoreductase n=1 Tax=Leucosporidium creatinivorum TaxID=106004 RepID=A0A1Y2G259_9BASI|nr:oxidoreductase [Leucosporidium creatinivorum]